MKILFSSHSFAPAVGGVEEVGGMLARAFANAGHNVIVTTQTEGPSSPDVPYGLWRRPSLLRLAQLVHWSDLCFHNNISLRAGWPLIWFRRKWVIVHHTWIRRPNDRVSWQDCLKLAVLRRARNIAVSDAIAAHLPVPSQVIRNPYRSDLFQRNPDAVRDRDLVFVGRLVSDKGVDLLLQAVALLRRESLWPTLTIVGDGPEETNLRRLVEDLKLQEQVTFAGTQVDDALVRVLNRHRFIVIPSRWREPFGLVALEGLACGCTPIAADGGGLPEAVGRCGIYFSRGDASSLSRALGQALGDRVMVDDAKRAEHLERHRLGAVVASYLEVLASEAVR